MEGLEAVIVHLGIWMFCVWFLVKMAERFTKK